jgi:hypothetical protein
MSYEEKGQGLYSQQGPLFANLLAATLESLLFTSLNRPLDLRYCFLSLQSQLLL